MERRQIDNRGLEPPQPMVRILSELAAMPAEEELEALMDREPVMLYPELERRGFSWTFERGPGGGTLVIRRAVG